MNLKLLKKTVKKLYSERMSHLFFHNWEHTMVVRKYALKLGRALGADLELLEAAALLHDVGYIQDPQSARHEEESVEYAYKLAETPEFSRLKPRLDEIGECILATRVGATSDLLEAKITKDADLIQFTLENYPKKVFELNFELNTNKKVQNLPLRDFVRNTPAAMEMWIPYDRKTGDVGFVTETGKKWASKGYLLLIELYEFFQEISEDLSDSEFETMYVKFIMELEEKRKKHYHKIVKDEFIITLAKSIFFREKLTRLQREQSTLREAELKINQGLSLNEVITHILKSTVDVLDAHAATLFTVEADDMIHFADTYFSELVPVAGSSRDAVLAMKPLEKGQGVVGQVIDTGESRMVKDTSREEGHFRKPSDDIHLEVKTMLTVPIMYYGAALGAIQVLNKDSAGRIISFNDNDLSLAEGMARIAGVAINRARLYDSIIRTFIDLINARDNYTRRHTESVTRYAMRIGRAIGLDEKDLKKVMYAASLHDIGKIGTPEGILNKPGKLEDDEFDRMKEHVVLPEKVQAISFPPYLADVPYIASCHHERYDGRGYKRGLKGEDIPLIARILAVADVFDALTSDRPYREAMPVEMALEILREGKGSQFEPELVDVFIDQKLYINPEGEDE